MCVNTGISYKEFPMARGSIFDPEGGQTEHSGSTFMGPRADNLSHMPPDVVDGDAREEEVEDLEESDVIEEDTEQPESYEAPDKTDPDLER
jgi:hypothetical protein